MIFATKEVLNYSFDLEFLLSGSEAAAYDPISPQSV
jgi:hypothetical protein